MISSSVSQIEMWLDNELVSKLSHKNKASSMILVLILILAFVVGLRYVTMDTKLNIFPSKVLSTLLPNIHIPSKINVINLTVSISGNITCVKTKLLLNVLRTTICVHDTTDMLSRSIIADKIWEEVNLGLLFRVLFRYPDFAFIDVGANIGTYTMFATTLGRFVMAIECFQPNYLRIIKAAQLENVTDRLVLIGNAIFSRSDEYLRLKSVPQNIGGQEIDPNSLINPALNDPYIVKTLRFDDLLPILKQKEIRSVVMKIDIEGSEDYFCNSSAESFDYLDVPVILMEWANVKLVPQRVSTVVEFFTKRKYTATTDTCRELKIEDAFTSWPWDIYWVKMNRLDIC